MLVKGCLRLFSSKNLGLNRIISSMVNSLMYQNRFFLRNVHATGNVVLKTTDNSYNDISFGNPIFKEYVVKNSNFKNSVLEIANLNFTVDDRHESLKLLLQLRENSEDDRLWQESRDCLKRELNTFDMKDLLKAIALTLNLKLKKSKFSEDFITSLDKELLSREFSFDDVLEVLFVLRHTYTGNSSLKHFRFYLKTFRRYLKLHRCQPFQVVHIFYHFEEFTKVMRALYKFAILKYLEGNLSSFNTDELGIIIAGLVKGKLFKGDNKFIKQIIDQMMNEIENMESLHLLYLSKFLLGSSAIHQSKIIMDFQEKLIPYVSKFNESSLICSLFSGFPHTLNLSLWDSVVERCKTDLKSLGIVNIHRLMKITTTFNVNNEEFLKLAVEAVEDLGNADAYNSRLISFCKDLVIHQIYSKKLLDIIFSKDFIDEMLSRSFARDVMEWSFIHFTLKIDKPELKFPCVDEELEKKIKRNLHNFQPLGKPIISLLRSRIILGKVLKKAYGEDEVSDNYCLMHFERGVIMRFDDNLNALPIPEEYKQTFKKVNKPPLDESIWICMNVLYSASKSLTPLQETYARHLKAIGYLPILIPNFEFHCLGRKETEEKIKYLKSLIESGVKEALQEKQTKLKS